MMEVQKNWSEFCQGMQKNGSQTDRVEYFDLFRAFGIILMVLGHIGLGAVFDFFIHAFHMPIFFIISGFFFKHKSKEDLTCTEFVLKKARSLLLPYLFFGIIAYIIWVFRHGFDIAPLKNLFGMNTISLPIAGALWFLTALFVSEVIYFVISRIVKNSMFIFLACLLIACAGTLLGGVILPCHLQSDQEWLV